MLAQMDLFVYGNSAGNSHVDDKTRQVTILISQQNPPMPPFPKAASVTHAAQRHVERGKEKRCDAGRSIKTYILEECFSLAFNFDI